MLMCGIGEENEWMDDLEMVVVKKDLELLSPSTVYWWWASKRTFRPIQFPSHTIGSNRFLSLLADALEKSLQLHNCNRVVGNRFKKDQKSKFINILAKGGI